MDKKLYTWIDVQDWIEDYFYSNKNEGWLNNINFRSYWDGLNITFKIDNRDQFVKTNSTIIEKLKEIFLARFFYEDQLYILLEGKRIFPVIIEEVESNEIEQLPFYPSVGRLPFIGSRKKILKARQSDSVPILFAYHSFKGGVGRTLHAMAHAINLSKKNRVLLIDADFEAPGITWLIKNDSFAFSDLLALVHGNNVDQYESIIDEAAENIKKNSFYENNKLYILPAFRGLREGGIPTLEVKPEHIFKFSNNPYILTDIIEKLALKLQVEYVILDLRAGVSELSSGWFFDPKVNKVFVSTLTSQSLLGTSKMFEILSDFRKKNNIEKETLPFLILSQVPKEAVKTLKDSWEMNTYSDPNLDKLKNTYTSSFINLESLLTEDSYKDLTEEEIVGKTIGPLTFFSVENDNLKSLPDLWEDVSTLIKKNDLDSDMSQISSFTAIEDSNNVEKNEDFEESRKNLHATARDLVFAEQTTINDFLITKHIRNLMFEFRTEIPISVVIGAKGSGKTFLYKQIVYSKVWSEFIKRGIGNSISEGYILPVTIPQNLSTKDNFTVLPEQIKALTNANIDKNIWLEYIKPDIEKHGFDKELTVTEWREKWLDYISWAAGYEINIAGAGRKFLSLLSTLSQKIVAVFDGLEDLFKQFNNSIGEQRAIEALLQDVPTWLESQSEKRLGIIVFIRKDIVLSAISQNSGQFIAKYDKFELKWDSEEALRLVHWIINKYNIFKSPTFHNWENELKDKKFNDLIEPLHKLWGMRMASNNSNEAYTHNWVLGSLANLKKEVQSRDIVRFLDFAAEESLNQTKEYSDRVCFPSAIRTSIQKVGKEKIDEVGKENEPLKKVLDILALQTGTIKFPCKPSEIKDILDDSQIIILVNNGVIILHQGEYYMAEIYRKGIGFDYSRRGKPKVLYF